MRGGICGMVKCRVRCPGSVGKTNTNLRRYQFGVREEANGKTGQLRAAEMLRWCSSQSGRPLVSARTSSPVTPAHTRNKQSPYAGPLNFERLQIDIECKTTRLLCMGRYSKHYVLISVDKKNQLDVTFCILYFSSNRCSTCFGQPCAHHQELTTA